MRRKLTRKLTLAIVVVSILVALGVPAAQATTTQPQTIPSGTEVIPYIFHDTESESGHASSIKLYDPAKHTSETIKYLKDIIGLCHHRDASS